MAYVRVSDFERHSENPFIEEAIEDVERHKVKKIRKINAAGDLAKEAGQIVVQSSTGEPIAYGAFMEYIELDEKQFAKFYVSELERFYELNQSGRKVLSYLITKLKPNQDIVVLRIPECLEYTGYKHKKNVMDGIGNLIQNSVIARAKYENEYFINPMVLFNGNRVTYARTIIKKKQEVMKNQIGLFETDKS
jgi:hypothetical protein